MKYGRSMEDKLTLRQMVNRIKKAIPEINPAWVSEHLKNNTDCDFRNDPREINTWINHFKALSQ